MHTNAWLTSDNQTTTSFVFLCHPVCVFEILVTNIVFFSDQKNNFIVEEPLQFQRENSLLC